MRSFAAAFFAIALCASPAAGAQFGGSPDVQVDGDGAPLDAPYGVDDGKWDEAGDRDEWGDKADWASEEPAFDDETGWAFADPGGHDGNGAARRILC